MKPKEENCSSDSKTSHQEKENETIKTSVPAKELRLYTKFILEVGSPPPHDDSLPPHEDLPPLHDDLIPPHEDPTSPGDDSPPPHADPHDPPPPREDLHVMILHLQCGSSTST